MSIDEKPPEKPTVKMETPPDWAISLTAKVVDIAKDVKESRDESSDRFDRLEGTVTVLVGDHRGLHARVTDIEARIARVESPTNPPLTSQRVGAIAEASASKMNLEQDAKIGLLLAAKDEEIAKLRAESATKDDIAKALEDASKVQTEAIVAGVKTTIDTIAKTPTAKRLTSAIVPVLLLAMAVIGYRLEAELSKLRAAPQQQSTVVQLAAPVTVYADAGADR